MNDNRSVAQVLRELGVPGGRPAAPDAAAELSAPSARGGADAAHAGGADVTAAGDPLT